MHSRHLALATMMASCLLTVACKDQAGPALLPADVLPSAPSAATAASNGAPTDTWGGKWNGPEGTYLQISGQQGQYEIVISNLDGPRSFQGRSQNGRIAFTRDGVDETIHPTDGQATGMKWLADKKDCLTVKAGEGYCRD